MAEIKFGKVTDYAAWRQGAGPNAIEYKPITLEEAQEYLGKGLKVTEAGDEVTVAFSRREGVTRALVAENDEYGSSVEFPDWQREPITLTARIGQHVALFGRTDGDRVEIGPSVPQQ